jgi:hypothetical protein
MENHRNTNIRPAQDCRWVLHGLQASTLAFGTTKKDLPKAGNWIGNSHPKWMSKPEKRN